MLEVEYNSETVFEEPFAIESEVKIWAASAIVHDQPKSEMLIDELLKLYNFRARKLIKF